MRQARSLDRVALSLMLLCCVSWGLQQVLAKLALAEVPPITQAAIRSVGGTLIIGGWSWWRDRSVFRRDGSFWPGIATGVLFALEFLALFIGLQWTSASHAALFLYTAPFFVALGAAFLLPHERLRAGQWLGLMLSFIGVAIALGVSTQQGMTPVIGDLLTLAAGAFWAMVTLTVKATRLSTAPGRQGSALPACGLRRAPRARRFRHGRELAEQGCLSCRPQACSTRRSGLPASPISSGIGSCGNIMRARCRPSPSSRPLMGVLAGHFLLGDAMESGLVLAVALVLGGIILVNRPRPV